MGEAGGHGQADLEVFAHDLVGMFMDETKT